jgi:hypothetical protein
MKYVRYTLLSLIFLGAVGALAGYFFFRRSVPVQARFIPNDAVLVLTADMRELALNAKGGKPLLPERGGDAVNKQLAALSRVISDYKGGGIAQTADVQLFLFRRNESAWAGAAIELANSDAFGTLLRSPELNREILLAPAGNGLFTLDSSGMVLGWNSNAALLLYPVGNHDKMATAKMLSQLLSLPEANSIASNKAFCNAVLQEFDISIWVNPAEAIALSQSDPLAALFGNISTLYLTADFSDGELTVKRHIIENNYLSPKQITTTANSRELAYWNFSTTTLYKHPAADLFFDDNALSKELAALLTGECVVYLHDTLSYSSQYTETVMDENFNTVQREVSTSAFELGHTCTYTIKKGSDVNAVFQRASLADSNIVRSKNAWQMATGSLTKTAFVQNELLYVSTKHGSAFEPGRNTSAFPLAAEVKLPQLLHMLPVVHNNWPPQWLGIAALLEKYIQQATLSKPVFRSSNSYSDEFTLSFTTKDINTMLQLRDLIREAAWLMQQNN